MLALITISIFISVLLLTWIILAPIVVERGIVRERLDKLTTRKGEKLSLVTEKTPFQRLLDRIGEKIALSSNEQSKYAKLLMAAGFRKETVFIFLGSKILFACVLPAIFVFLFVLPKGKLMDPESLLIVATLAIAGYLLPSVWMQRQAERRKLTMFHTLPDMLDLLSVCVDAGLSVDAALIRASENLQFKGNPLAEEFKTAAMESRAGKPRAEALKDMAARTGVDDVRAFVTMLIQTERFGTSLSQALKVHSDSLRTRRRQIAEEAAAKTAVKMLFPLVFFIFPALLIIILGPAVFKINKLFQ